MYRALYLLHPIILCCVCVTCSSFTLWFIRIIADCNSHGNWIRRRGWLVSWVLLLPLDDSNNFIRFCYSSKQSFLRIQQALCVLKTHSFNSSIQTISFLKVNTNHVPWNNYFVWRNCNLNNKYIFVFFFNAYSKKFNKYISD